MILRPVSIIFPLLAGYSSGCVICKIVSNHNRQSVDPLSPFSLWAYIVATLNPFPPPPHHDFLRLCGISRVYKATMLDGEEG
ncbi:hypothetical protein BXZ70DRAFT_303367 [Cristinia sonorae]|uniref:Secreted protein n=1 Tax=Cristinia sonorae TaxID=1940300 RepID=A0A8K0XNI9_9AGAR|nr:hypothetical protein BXZ70DRAFT_303367 [Cristinia sonorae]